MTAKKQLLFKTIIIVGCVFVALGAGEIVARIMTPRSLFTLLFPVHDMDVRTVHGVQLWESEKLSRYSKEDLARAAAADTFLIVGLGDSIMYGAGLDADQTYPVLLEQSLKRATGRRVDFVNLAFPGYNAIQESIVFEEKGAGLKPDLVVLHFWQDDAKTYTVIEGNAYDAAFYARDGRLLLSTIPLPKSINDFLILRSRLYQTLSLKMLESKRKKEQADALDTVLREHGKIFEAAGHAGVMLVLSPELDRDLSTPHRAPVQDMYRRVAANAREHGALVVDLRERLLEQDHRDIAMDAAHFNAKGSRVVAGILAQEIIPLIEDQEKHNP